jgi:NAD(P)-dependent dehydrogenase (short-subunit alcohol dehydrogenase family)
VCGLVRMKYAHIEISGLNSFVAATGCNTGLGLYLTKLVLKKGEKIVATSPFDKPEVLTSLEKRYGQENILVLKVDVTNEQEIDSAFAVASNHFGKIDVVYNNAGIPGPVGEFEMASHEAARRLFDVGSSMTLYLVMLTSLSAMPGQLLGKYVCCKSGFKTVQGI